MSHQPDLFAAPRHTRSPNRGSGTRATSAEAKAAVDPLGPKLRREVFEAIASRGETGATDEEVVRITGLSPSTARPRRVELVEAGLVVATNVRRRGASGRSLMVWRAVPR